MPQERYSIAQATKLLRTKESTLRVWIRRAGLSEAIQRQRMEDDMREHYLTRKQLEVLAGQHRRVLEEAPAPTLEEIDAALSERIEALERRVSALEGLAEDDQPTGKLPRV